MDWIKCTDRMPPENEYVLVTAIHNRTGKRVVIGQASIMEFWSGYAGRWFGPVSSQNDYWLMEGEDYTVTHWMPYPEPAKED